MDGLTHSIQIFRHQITVTGEGQPQATLVAVGSPFMGYIHENKSMEAAVAASLGSQSTGHCLAPYGTPIQGQDRLRTTFPDGTTETFRVIAVRDNHVMLRADVERDVG